MADETVLRIKERIRQEMRDLLGVTMADGGSIDRQALPAQIDGVAHEVCADFGISDENWIGYIIKSTVDDFIGLGPLQPLQDDPKVAEIFIDPVGVKPDGTFITPVARAEVDGQIVDCPGIDLVSHDEVGRLIGRIAEEANRRCDDSFPEMDATLADGSRVHAAHPKVSPNGWSLNIRKFSKDKLTAEDLLERGAMSEPMYMFLKSAVKARANFIISGGTGSGKTTMLNALSAFIGYNERVVTIEDTRELQLKQRIVIPASPAHRTQRARASLRCMSSWSAHSVSVPTVLSSASAVTMRLTRCFRPCRRVTTDRSRRSMRTTAPVHSRVSRT